jgi:putative transcriptional regulator
MDESSNCATGGSFRSRLRCHSSPPARTSVALATTTVAQAMTTVTPEMATSPVVRDLRQSARLTQQEFAARLGVPVETIRNWEQGKRMPRGPARALLAVIAHAPETVFAALARP